MRVAMCAALAVALIAAAAQAQTPPIGKTVAEFGFTGRWAIDCTQPPSLENAHRAIWTDDKGAVRFKDAFGDKYFPLSYRVLAAKRIDNDLLELRVERTAQGRQDQIQKLVLMAEGNRTRTVANSSPDGRIYVKDGYAMPGEQPTPWLNRCAP